MLARDLVKRCVAKIEKRRHVLLTCRPKRHVSELNFVVMPGGKFWRLKLTAYLQGFHSRDLNDKFDSQLFRP